MTHTLSLVKRKTIVALALTIDVGLIQGANGLTKSFNFFKSRFAEASVRVAIIVVSRWAISTNSLNPDILRSANTLLSNITIELVNSSARGNCTDLSINIISLSS